MENENNNSYIETFVKKLTNDKFRLSAFILGIVSAICSFIFMAEMSLSIIPLLFTLFILAAAIVNVIYSIDVENKNKYKNDLVMGGIALTLLGCILRTVQLGTYFSVQYFIAYMLFGVAFIMLALKFGKNQGKNKTIIIFLAILAAYDIIEFIMAKNGFTKGFFWKLYHISEATLFIDYIMILMMNGEDAPQLGDSIKKYVNQIPTMKICIILLAFISAVAFAIGLVKNLNYKSSTTVTSTVTETAVQATATPAPVNKAKGTVSGGSTASQDAATNATTQAAVITTAAPAVTPVPLTPGQTITTANYEFTLNNVKFSYDVKPDNPPSYYNHYVADSGQVYLYVNANVKNLQKQSLECDEIYSVTATYDSGYTYESFNIVTDTDGDFTYANITSLDPLQTLGVHCLIDCPQEVETSGKPLTLTFNFNDGSKYSYTVR